MDNGMIMFLKPTVEERVMASCKDCKYFSNCESNNKNKEILLDFYCRCMTTFKKHPSECKQHKYQDGEIICYANCPKCGKETWSRYK